MLRWVERITLELDNLRAVLACTLEERPELALRIGGNLLYTDLQWLHPTEAISWLEPAVEKARALLTEEETKIRNKDFSKALLGLGIAHGWQGRKTGIGNAIFTRSHRTYAKNQQSEHERFELSDARLSGRNARQSW